MDGLGEWTDEIMRWMYRGVCVNQPALFHVDQQSKVSQEISAKDGLLHVSNDENP